MNTRLVRRLIAAAALAAIGTAHAVPVTVSINGLPPGLSATLTVKRNVCPDGMGWVDNAAQALTETSQTIIERVTTPLGQTTFRSRVVTRYVASFDTPVTPASSPIAYERRCSTLGMADDLFQFGIQVQGFNAGGQAAKLSGFVAQTLQSASVAVNATLAAKTNSFTPVNGGALARGMVHTLEANFGSSLGGVQGQRLDLQRPSALIPGMFSTVASLFVRSDGAACVQAGASTHCLGEPGLVQAGNVILRGLQRNIQGQPGTVRFQFELMQGFGTGTLRLRAAADASDLPAYLVDGTPQAIQLLPWQALDQTVTVQ
jgi:hypothetical protein